MKNFTAMSRAATALGITIGAAVAMAPSASAAVACSASIKGVGASLQKTAQTKWGAGLLDAAAYNPHVAANQLNALPVLASPVQSYCTSPNTVRYASAGSGNGRKAWSSDGVTPRDPGANFIATDEPADPTEETNIEKTGLTAVTQVETLPVAQAAIAIIANLPTGCALATSTSRTATLSNLEKLQWGTTSTWGSLLGASALTPSSCATKPVTRIARLDASGSSFAYKKVLNSNNAHWSTPNNYTSAANNTFWPSAVTKPTATGGGAVAALVNSTPGSLGYVDLATARGAGFGFTGTADKTFWLRLNAAAAGGTTITNDPAKDAAQTPATPGANCGASRTYAGVPTSTQGNWFNVTGAKATYASGEYPICTLTYAMAYDKYSNVPGNTANTTATVKQYLRYITGATTGQTVLASGDYQALSSSLNTLNTAGLARILF